MPSAMISPVLFAAAPFAENTQLRDLCRRHGILYALVPSHLTPLNKIMTLLHDFRHHTEEYYLSQAEKRLEEVLIASQGQLETVLGFSRESAVGPFTLLGTFSKVVCIIAVSLDDG
ncbi:hypothetical protein VE00_04787 [Pseudogymnoascus sp. WSF 3629]|nr:hypothetical protein VE00_04787 [Pseudogymnoascus sp. WSF 3629]